MFTKNTMHIEFINAIGGITANLVKKSNILNIRKRSYSNFECFGNPDNEVFELVNGL